MVKVGQQVICVMIRMTWGWGLISKFHIPSFNVPSPRFSLRRSPVRCSPNIAYRTHIPDYTLPRANTYERSTSLSSAYPPCRCASRTRPWLVPLYEPDHPFVWSTAPNCPLCRRYTCINTVDIISCTPWLCIYCITCR